MLLSKVQGILEAEVLSGENLQEIDVHSACGCDLMSDVLAYVKDQALLLTGLVNPQVVRTAEMMDIIAICFVRGKRPDDEIIKLAKEKNITLITTEHPLYTACGLLYQAGLEGGAVYAK